jgi:hypothetical protein
MRFGNVALAIFSASWVGACGFLPPSQQQEFAVSAAPPSSAAGLFSTIDPNLNDTLARQNCVEGYERLGEQTVPADPGTLAVWRLRCAPHASWYSALF